MRDTRGLLILLVVVIALAAGAWWFTRPEPAIEPPPEPETAQPLRFRHDGVAVQSPELAVGPALVRGTVHPQYTAWRVEIACADAAGCAGELAVEIRYSSGQGDGTIVFRSRSDVPSGGTLIFEGLQDPPTRVEGIELVTLEVRSRDGAGGAVEIPL